MPIGELIGELVLRLIFEFVFYGLWYWTGRITLTILSFGLIKFCPIGEVDEPRRKKGKQKKQGVKKKKRSLWVSDADGNNRKLQADATVVVGALIWILAGVGLYFLLR